MTAGFWQQTGIFFRKTVRVAMRERFYKSLIFTVIIAVLVMAVASDNMLIKAGRSQSGFFTLCSAVIWIGIFNTIQTVCREHEIIHADARAGMMVSAYVNATMLWQIILSFFEAIIFFVVSVIFLQLDRTGKVGLIFGVHFDFFLTIFLLLIGSSCLGLLISAIANNGTMAMTIMPFVLIVQFILCGVLFKLSGIASAIGVLTFSRWGMNALGSEFDLNNLETYQNPMTGQRAFYHLDDAYNYQAGSLLLAWGMIILLTVLFFFGTILVLKLRNRDGPLLDLSKLS